MSRSDDNARFVFLFGIYLCLPCIWVPAMALYGSVLLTGAVSRALRKKRRQ